MASESPLAQIPICIEPAWTVNGLMSFQLRVGAELSCPRGPTIGAVDFLIDTGATFSLVHYMDAERLGINVRSLQELDTARTAAGPLRIARLDEVTLTMMTSSSKHPRCLVTLESIGVAVIPRDSLPPLKQMPSLLGMDVIACFRLVSDMLEEIAYLDVFNSSPAVYAGSRIRG